MRLLLVAAVCLASLPALACGDGGGDSGEAKVEAVVRSYFDHYIDSEIADIYPLLDAASQRACPEEQFVSVMSDVRNAVGELEIELIEISEVVIEGDEATVTSKLRLDDRTGDDENMLIKEGSDWKIQLPPEVCQG